jgi:hypothetical protein
MPNFPYGVECKTPNCGTGIILGDIWIEDRPLRQGDRVTFPVLNPIRIKCEKCGLQYEYTQGDLVRFPEAPPANPGV